MNERDQFQSQVKRLLKPALIADGFRGSGNTYRRILGEVVHIVALQGSKHGGQCCVSLGIHLTFFPGSPDAAEITELDCEFRTRLAPPGQSDCWWSYRGTEQEARAAAESILRLYREVGAPYFQSFSIFPDDFIRVTPPMLASNVELPFPRGNTKVRRALALCRIALRAGRRADARQFAAFGLAHIGPAIGLKDEFNKVLATEGDGCA